jgi:hypothetical protein
MTQGLASGAARAVASDGIAQAFRDALCGPANVGSPQVVWADGGDRIVLLVDRLQVRTSGSVLVVAVDTESDEFGGAALIARFVFGTEQDPAMLVAATDAAPLGHPEVAARWGELFRSVIWAAFARLVEVTAGGKQPGRIRLHDGGLDVTVQERASIRDLAHAHFRQERS